MAGIMGCGRPAQPITEQEKAEQDVLMREFLNGSSPRNMNGEPKAIPEFSHFFTTRPTPKCDEPRD